MFKRREIYKNGVDALRKASDDSSAERVLAARKLARTLEKLKSSQDEAEIGRLIEYARKSGVF